MAELIKGYDYLHFVMDEMEAKRYADDLIEMMKPMPGINIYPWPLKRMPERLDDDINPDDPDDN